MSFNKQPTVWNKLIDQVDVSDSMGIRIQYEEDGKSKYVYLNESGLRAIIGSVNTLKEAVSLLETKRGELAVNKKAAQAFNRAYKAMFDLTQNDTLAKQAGEAAKQAVISLKAS